MHRGGVREKLVHERPDVGDPFAERRHLQRDALDPVVDVGPEAPRLHLVLERTQRRRDEPDVHRDLRRSPDTHEPPVLEKPEQLHLCGERHLSNLVEKEGASCRRLDLAAGSLARAGESALLVAEELALEQSLRNRRAVDGDEGAVMAMREVVKATREDLLSCAALANERHDDVLAGDEPQHPVELAHGRRVHCGLENYVKLSLRGGHEPVG